MRFEIPLIDVHAAESLKAFLVDLNWRCYRVGPGVRCYRKNEWVCAVTNYGSWHAEFRRVSF
jgi:hypothetical protein